MAVEPKNEYQPDYVSPPGDTLSEMLVSRGMKQSDLAKRTGRTPKHINEIIQAKACITPETALQLERVLSIPASFWSNRQRHYDEYLAHKKEIQQLNSRIEWVRNFPYNPMVKHGWVPECKNRMEQLKNLLNFFSVASPNTWSRVWSNEQVSYRKSEMYEPNEYSLAAWLRQGEIVAQTIDCKPYNEAKFLEVLSEIRALTLTSPEVFHPRLIELCASCGVAVAFVKELPKTASGATRWLTSTKALIQLSLKYNTDDHLWFTFFHEAGHVLSSKKRAIFIETSKRQEKSDEENRANKFATEFLIPLEEWDSFPGSRISKSKILSFSNRLGISPGIVVGQLQKRQLLPYSHCNDLKRTLKWAS